MCKLSQHFVDTSRFVDIRIFTENSDNAHLDGVLLVRLDGVEPHEVPGQAPGQPRQRGAVLDRLAAVVDPDPLRGTPTSTLQSFLMNVTTSSNLEIVVASMENDTNIVNVRVEVVEKLSVVNVGQLITGLDKTTNCIVAKIRKRFFYREKMFAYVVYCSSFLHPHVDYVGLVS